MFKNIKQYAEVVGGHCFDFRQSVFAIGKLFGKTSSKPCLCWLTSDAKRVSGKKIQIGTYGISGHGMSVCHVIYYSYCLRHTYYSILQELKLGKQFLQQSYLRHKNLFNEVQLVRKHVKIWRLLRFPTDRWVTQRTHRGIMLSWRGRHLEVAVTDLCNLIQLELFFHSPG